MGKMTRKELAERLVTAWAEAVGARPLEYADSNRKGWLGEADEMAKLTHKELDELKSDCIRAKIEGEEA